MLKTNEDGISEEKKMLITIQLPKVIFTYIDFFLFSPQKEIDPFASEKLLPSRKLSNH